MTSNQNDASSLIESEKEIKEKLKKVVLKAWSDPEFRSYLHKQPDAALQSIGISFGDHIIPHFHIDNEKDRHFIIPQNPAELFIKDIDYNLNRLATLHVEVTSTVSWSGQSHPTPTV